MPWKEDEDGGTVYYAYEDTPVFWLLVFAIYALFIYPIWVVFKSLYQFITKLATRE
jgi:hypothetical protein